MKHSHRFIIMFLFQMKLKRTHKASEGTLTWDVAVICTSLLLLFHLRMLWARPSFAGSKCLLWLMCFGYHWIKSQLESPDFLSKITVPFSKPTWAIENNHVSEEIHLQMVVFFHCHVSFWWCIVYWLKQLALKKKTDLAIHPAPAVSFFSVWGYAFGSGSASDAFVFFFLWG